MSTTHGRIIIQINNASKNISRCVCIPKQLVWHFILQGYTEIKIIPEFVNYT